MVVEATAGRGIYAMALPICSQGRPDCPPPTELVCIKTEKVYESCRRVQTNEEVTDLSGIAVGDILDVWCVDVDLVVNEQFPFVCEKIAGTRRAKVSYYYQYRFAYVDQEGQKFYTSNPIFHETTVVMSDRIMEKGLYVQCEVFLDCLQYYSGIQQVTCCRKLQLFKLVAQVSCWFRPRLLPERTIACRLRRSVLADN